MERQIVNGRDVAEDVDMVVVAYDLDDLDDQRQKHPNKRVLLCQLHAKMAVHSFIESECDNKKKAFKRLWKDIVYSKTREEYVERLASFKDAVGSKHPLYQHVMNKWDPIKTMWVSFERGDIPPQPLHTVTYESDFAFE